jgi:hypothetical protein
VGHILQVNKLPHLEFAQLVQTQCVVFPSQTDLGHGIILEQSLNSRTHSDIVQSEQETAVTSCNLQQRALMVYTFLKTGTRLGVETKHWLREQIIHCSLGLGGRQNHNYAPGETYRRKGGNRLLIYLILYQLFHFCVQNYKKNPDL